jgi:hypothetical protein
LFGGISGADQMFAEGVERMANKGRSMAVDELLIFFKAAEYRRELAAPPVFSSGIAALALLKDGMRTGKIPVLLTTRLLLFCSPRDRAESIHQPAFPRTAHSRLRF